MFLLLHLVLHLKKRTPNGRRQLLSFQRLERSGQSDNIAFEPLIIHQSLREIGGFSFVRSLKFQLFEAILTLFQTSGCIDRTRFFRVHFANMGTLAGYSFVLNVSTCICHKSFPLWLNALCRLARDWCLQSLLKKHLLFCIRRPVKAIVEISSSLIRVTGIRPDRIDVYPGVYQR